MVRLLTFVLFLLIAIPCAAEIVTNTSQGGGGGGSGTVTSITAANSNVVVTPSPLTTVGTIGLGSTLAITNGIVIGSTVLSSGVALDLGSETSSFLLPVGTTGTRPSTGINGMLRYDTTSTAGVEGYINNSWQEFLTNASNVPIAWNSAITYLINSIVSGSDNNYYRAVTTTTGNDPTSDAGSHWVLAKFNVNTELDIPSRFSTFQTAWTFAENATCVSGATLTLKWADGSYSYGANNFNLNHICGSQIQLIGNTTTPTNVVLNWSSYNHPQNDWVHANFGLFNVSYGSSIGLIDGFKIVGPGMSGGTGGNAFNSICIEAFGNSSAVVGPHITTDGCYAGVAAFQSSSIKADGSTFANGGDGNVWSSQGSSISCIGCTSTGAGTWFSGSGYLVDNHSMMFLYQAVASGNLNGISLFSNSEAQMYSVNFSTNSLADIWLVATPIENIEGNGTLSSTTPRIIQQENFVDGCTYIPSTTVQEVTCGNNTISGHLTDNNGNQGLLTINKSGTDAFGGTGNTTPSYNLFTNSTIPIKLGTNNIPAVTIDSNQNVGIGTTSPLNALAISVNTPGAYQGFGVFQRSATGVPVFQIWNANQVGNVGFFVGSSSQSLRSEYGLTGNFSDVTAFGLSNFAIGTADSEPLIFGTNSIERMRVAANGTVAIGTATPNNALEIYTVSPAGYSGESIVEGDATGVAVMQETNGAGTIGLYAGNASQSLRTVYGLTGNETDLSSIGFGAFAVGTIDNAPLILGAFNTEYVRIPALGGMAIGTTSLVSSAKLSVNGGISQTTVLNCANGVTTNASGLFNGCATATGGTVTTTGSPSSGNLTKFSGAAAITNGDLSGDVTTSGTLATTVAKIQSTTVSGTTGSTNVMFSASPTTTGTLTGAAANFSGSVGIGTTSPNNKLEVYVSTSAAYSGETVFQADATGVGTMQVFNNGGNVGFFTGNASQSLRTIYGLTGNFSDATSNGVSNFAVGTSDSANLIFGTNGSERARITTSGNMVVGSTTANAVFDVANSSGSAFRVAPTASEVDYIQVTGGVTGSPGNTTISILGTDTNVGLVITPKGTGGVGIGTTAPNAVFDVANSSGSALRVAPTASEVDYIQITGGTTASPGNATISSLGTDTNVNLTLTPKGTGQLKSTTESLSGSLSVTGQVGIGTAANGSFPLYVNGTTQLAPASAANVENIVIPNSNTGLVITNVSGTATYQAQAFFTGGNFSTQVGSISVTSTATVYNVSSDERVKKDFRPLLVANKNGNIIDQLKPVTFNFRKQYDPEQSQGNGFIAQQLYKVIPEAVTPGDTINAEYDPKNPSYKMWQIDMSKIIPRIVSDLQNVHKELNAEHGAFPWHKCQLLGFETNFVCAD